MTSSSGFTTLLGLALEGNRDANNELISAASERLLKLTRKMLANYPHLRRWEQTDDVFQTAVMRLQRSLADVQPDSACRFFGLATTQIRRTLIDLARHHFGPEGQAAKHETQGAKGVIGNATDYGDQPETLDSWARFHESVDALADEERDVFQLVWYGGMEQKEVATLLDISTPTVQRRWYKAQMLVNRAMRGEQPPCGENLSDDG